MSHHLTQEFYCPVIALIFRGLASETLSSVDQFTCFRKLEDIANFGPICKIVTVHKVEFRLLNVIQKIKTCYGELFA